MIQRNQDGVEKQLREELAVFRRCKGTTEQSSYTLQHHIPMHSLQTLFISRMCLIQHEDTEESVWFWVQ